MMAEQNSDVASGASRRKFLAVAGSAGALVLAGCTTEEDSGNDGGTDTPSGSISISGSSTVFPLMSAIAENYERQNPQVNTNVTPTGSGAGFSNFFCVGENDFNNASRQIKPEEEQLCADNNVEYTELTLATDALTVIINNNNDFATEMTVEELAQIWESDAADTWNEVNSEWPNEPINRFGAADTSGTYDYFIENVQGSERGHTDDYQATEQDNRIVQGVKDNQYAIGYLGFAYYYQNQEQMTAVKIDNGDGPVAPNLDTAASGEYQPLSRSLYTYPSMSSLAQDHVADFARYAVQQTTDQQLVADNVGYVPLTEEAQQQQMQKLEDAIEEANS